MEYAIDEDDTGASCYSSVCQSIFELDYGARYFFVANFDPVNEATMSFTAMENEMSGAWIKASAFLTAAILTFVAY